MPRGGRSSRSIRRPRLQGSGRSQAEEYRPICTVNLNPGVIGAERSRDIQPGAARASSWSVRLPLKLLTDL